MCRAKTVIEPKRMGINKCRETTDDLLKVCLDPTVCLPLYFAADLNRLPPADTNHCSVGRTAISCAEIRSVGQLTAEVMVPSTGVSQLK